MNPRLHLAARWLLPSLFFVLVYAVAIHVPMHSDDYHYVLMGLAWDRHVAHYLGWSGRFVADYLSAGLLSLDYAVYTAINAAAAAALVSLIARLPALASGQAARPDGRGFYLPLLIFIVYWIANPNLGQTTFWIVGAANYLWTNLFIALFYAVLFFCLNGGGAAASRVALCITALAAGCANENTAVMVIGLTAFIWWYEKRNRAWVAVAWALNALGAAVLLLSPGNRMRATQFPDWYALDHVSKLKIHLAERLPDMLSQYWPLYLLIGIALALCIGLGRGKSRSVVYAGVFLAASFGASVVLAGSPYILPRTLQGGFCFLLISLAFLLWEVSQTEKREGAWGVWRTWTLRTMAVLGVAVFAVSYGLFFSAMLRTEAQAAIRTQMVEQARDAGLRSVEIPGFYFSKLLKRTDRFDPFHSEFMAAYFGLAAISIREADFDYSAVARAQVLAHVAPSQSRIAVNSVLVYEEHFCSKVLIEFDAPTYAALRGQGPFSVRVLGQDGLLFSKTLSDASILEVAGRFFSQPTGKCLSPAAIRRVDVVPL